MPAQPIEYHPQALLEVEHALAWYLERSPQAAAALLEELDRAVALIADSPLIWPPFRAGVRRCVLNGFPYSLFYRLGARGVQIVALAHQKRRPFYWRLR